MLHSRRPLLLAVVALGAAAACDASRPELATSAPLPLETCTRCHGDSANGNAAPPRSLMGKTATTELGVGAHQSHLHDSAIRQALSCSDCHVVPGRVDEPGHIGAGPAKLTFGELAQKRNAQPTFTSSTATCSSVYCHGATLGAGGTNHEPQWTKVDGTQAACGTCHDLPPNNGRHPKLASAPGDTTACSACHVETVKPDGTIDVAGGKHIDGRIEVKGAGCTACHGDPDRADLAGADVRFKAAPPRDTTGATDTTSLGVGAHQAHVAGGPLHAPLACANCHVVPPDTDNHPVGASDAEKLTFGAVAVSGGAAPQWSPATASCSATYCHGSTLNAGGTNHTPTWTKVGQGEAACGSCHGIPPPPETGHLQSTNCGSCHPGYTSTSVNLALHVNGVLDVGNLTCTSCHGDPTRAAVAGADPRVQAAPPTDTHGSGSSAVVGAHQAHVNNPSGLTAPIQCAECHPVPTSTAASATHRNGSPTLQFGGRAVAGGATPAWNATNLTCASTYCHGNFPGGKAATMTWNKPGTTCTTCHAAPPTSGLHQKHISEGRVCSDCHGAGYAWNGSTGTVNRATHVDGTVTVTNRITSWNPTTGDCVGCHGANNWFNPRD
jgi:predicted CxxxxCH...CXXCH cytochrome family protein